MRTSRILGSILMSIAPIVLALEFCEREHKSYGTFEATARLPAFRVYDVAKRLISSDGLKGKFSIFFFAGRDAGADRELFHLILSNYRKEVNAVFVEGPIRTYSELEPDPNAIIISDRTGNFRNLFQIPKYGFYVIYDPKGRKISGGLSQTDEVNGPGAVLRRILDGRDQDPELIVPAGCQSLDESPWLASLASAIQLSSRKYLIIGFLDTVCDGCYGGDVLLWLRELQSLTGDDMEIRCIFPPEYSKNDLINLSSHFRLHFVTEVADNLLFQKWKELVMRRGPDAVNGTVILVDRGGVVIKTMKSTDSVIEFARFCLELPR